MNTSTDHVRVAALADLHVHKGPQHAYRELLTEICGQANVLLLCGDLTNLGLPEEAEALAADLQTCRIPVLGVLGNHDHHSGRAEEVRKVLRAAMTFLDEETFCVGDVGFAGVKGFAGGFDKHMLTPFGEEAIKNFVAEAVNECLKLENQLTRLGNARMVVALHYAPVQATVMGEPVDIMPFLGCSRLAETIDRFPVAAVFHGHAHHGSAEGRTSQGIPVYNCSYEVLKRIEGRRPYSLIEV